MAGLAEYALSIILFSTHLKSMLFVRQLVRRLLSLIDLSLHSIISKVTPDLAVSISMHIIPSDHHASACSNKYFNPDKIQVFDCHDYRGPDHSQSYHNGTHYHYHFSYYHPDY